jgi:hypothetical protein
MVAQREHDGIVDQQGPAALLAMASHQLNHFPPVRERRGVDDRALRDLPLEPSAALREGSFRRSCRVPLLASVRVRIVVTVTPNTAAAQVGVALAFALE